MATAESKSNKLQEAESRKERAIEALDQAYSELCDAQKLITFVEGKESADLYDEIAGTYQTVRKLRQRLAAMKPTGLFEI